MAPVLSTERRSMCYAYSSLVSAWGRFWGPAASAPARSKVASASLPFNVCVEDDAHGLGLETQTQLRARQPDHAAVRHLLETAVSTSV